MVEEGINSTTLLQQAPIHSPPPAHFLFPGFGLVLVLLVQATIEN
jgi:hypothetical protein